MSIHRPFFRAADRHAMAIKALDPADWLEFGDDVDGQMQERRRLLAERPGDVVAALPGSEPAQAELLAVLLDHLARHAGDRYRVDADAVVERSSGRRFLRRDAFWLMLAGCLAQEDFCILQKRGDRHHLTAAVLCFPAHWSLAEKIGRPLVAIHDPVPGFADQLGAPVERLVDRLDADKPVQRLNWSLVDTDVLYLPPSHRTEPVTLDIDEIGERLHLRVERQTFRRLPSSDAVVFGIRTYVTPLGEAIDSAEAAEALIRRLHEFPEAMRRYKNLERVRTPLLAFLERRRHTML